MQNKFLKRYNDYSCICKNDRDAIERVCHYTSHIDAVINIANGCFWATNMCDFDDGWEGRLILKQIRKLIDNSTAKYFTDKQRKYIDDFIGDDNKISDFIDYSVTNVVSTCTNLDSFYMWEKYAKSEGYCIIFNRKKLVNSLWFKTKNGEKKCGHYIKHAEIIYDTEKQNNVIREEVSDLMRAQSKDLNEEDIIKNVLRHLMFVGHYYKKHSCQDDNTEYEKEEEYRILTDTLKNDGEFADLLPVQKTNNDKRYIELFFDKNAICEIICANQEALDNIKGQIKNKITVRSSNNNVEI